MKFVTPVVHIGDGVGHLGAASAWARTAGGLD